jgi:hypothetical protein
VADRSKATVCGRWLAGFAVSKPAGSTGSLCLVKMVFFQVVVSATGRSPFREVLTIVLCHCVWSRNLTNEVVLAHIRLLLHRNKKKKKVVAISVKNTGRVLADTLPCHLRPKCQRKHNQCRMSVWVSSILVGNWTAGGKTAKIRMALLCNCCISLKE